jgi:hypothetical protein
MNNRILASLAFCLVVILATDASAQQPPGYGPDVMLGMAKKAVEAAEAEP